eukprot:7752065-Pyramimonas_sp.AAC.1
MGSPPRSAPPRPRRSRHKTWLFCASLRALARHAATRHPAPSNHHNCRRIGCTEKRMLHIGCTA